MCGLKDNMSFFSKIAGNNKLIAVGLSVVAAVAVGVGMYIIIYKAYIKIISKRSIGNKDLVWYKK